MNELYFTLDVVPGTGTILWTERHGSVVTPGGARGAVPAAARRRRRRRGELGPVHLVGHCVFDEKLRIFRKLIFQLFPFFMPNFSSMFDFSSADFVLIVT